MIWAACFPINPTVFFSNGPGDPSSVTSGIALAKQLLESTDLPLFGICLGHQILGLALGGSTYKLNYGIETNHPCGTTGQVEITSQNHGFALMPPRWILSRSRSPISISMTEPWRLWPTAISRCSGSSTTLEASPGPHDADHHFGRFVTLMSDRRS